MRRLRSWIALVVAFALVVPVTPAAAVSRIESVSFADASNGLICGGVSIRQGFVASTHDGGVTWRPTRLADRWMLDVDAAGGTAGWAVSSYDDAAYKTSDGSTWATKSPVLGASTANFSDVAAFSGRTVVVGQNLGTGRGELAVIASTADDGATWTRAFEGPIYPPPVDPVTGDVTGPAPSTIAQLSAVDAAPGGMVGWAIGNEWSGGSGADLSKVTYLRPLIYATTNGGATWTTQTAPATGGMPVSAVAAASTSVAYAGGTGTRQYMKTVNGGATWTTGLVPRSTVAPAIEVNAIDATDANNVVMVGNSGVVVNSTDGGATWTQRVVGSGAGLRGISMLSPTSWVVVGDGETLLRTSDSGATWTGASTPTTPTGSVAVPAEGFALQVGAPVAISGSAADAGVGVISVEYRIRRSDSMCWNGIAWVAADTWLPAGSTNGWSTWSASFTPDAATAASGLPVTITARAADAVGNVSEFAGPTSGVPPFSAAVVLEGGAPYATSEWVAATVSAPAATHTRWSVNGGAFTPWVSMAATQAVDLGAADGAKTALFEFSANGGLSVLGSASDGIFQDTAAPLVTRSAPVTGFSYNVASVLVTGTASDAGSGLASPGAQVRIRRADGRSWDGSAWVSADTWLTPATSNGFAKWSLSWTPDADIKSSGQIVTISARARDAAGFVTDAPDVASGVLSGASVSLEGGAASTTKSNVTATIAAAGATHMRFSGDVTAASGWVSIAPTAAVTLTSGDGTKTVTFDFSADGGATILGSASDSILYKTPAPPGPGPGPGTPIVPIVAITAPAAGFALVPAALTISGTSGDVLGIYGVDVRIRRADGQTWNGLAWTTAETWLSASSADAFATWSYTWLPSAPALAGTGLVTITARATDVMMTTGLSDSVISAAPVSAAVSLASGAQYSSSATVTAAISAPGATHMRWIAGGATSVWLPISPTVQVALPSGDGTKTVTFEFSANAGATVFATAADTIVLDATPPSLVIAAPKGGFSHAVPAVTCTGSVTDALSGARGVQVRIALGGKYWNGSSWQNVETWLDANRAGSGWSYVWAVDAASRVATPAATISARAADAAGNLSAIKVVKSATNLPKAVLSIPAAPSSVRRSSVFTVSGTLKPRHPAGTAAVKLQFYRLEGVRWVLRKTVSAKVANYSTYSRYVVKTTITSTGKWRVRAYHADAGHAPSASSYRGMLVK